MVTEYAFKGSSQRYLFQYVRGLVREWFVVTAKIDQKMYRMLSGIYIIGEKREDVIVMKGELNKRLCMAPGFTIIEVVIVVTIIGILSAIATPVFLKWLPGIRLKGAARDLFGDMQATRMVAVKNNKNTAITFDPGNDRYLICNNWDKSTNSCNVPTRTVDLSSLKSGIGFGHGNATKEIDDPASTSIPDDVTYTSPDNIVVFTRQGGVESAGYVYLDHEEGTTTYVVGGLISGAIKVKRWGGGSWQ